MKKSRLSFSLALSLALSLVFGFLSFSMGASAQSIVILDGGSFARDCYDASLVSAQVDSASFEDIQACDNAIFGGHLTRRDLMATFVNRGILYSNMGKYDRAASDFKNALELSADVAETYLNRGNLWFVSGNFSEAIEDYNKAVELELKQVHVAYLNRGMVYETLGLFAKAHEDYVAALNVVPEWNLALEKLERVTKKQQQVGAPSGA